MNIYGAGSPGKQSYTPQQVKPFILMSAMASAASTAELLFLFLLVSTCFLPTLSQKTNSGSAAVHSPLPQFSFSFNFTNASSYDQSTDILLQGDAKVNGKLIDLTCNDVGQSSDGCTGRMSYGHQVPLHDDTTLASFSTSFTFNIRENRAGWAGDGMAFFLTGFPSRMPPNSTGQNLGLLSNNAAPYGPDQFVAVEFDTYPNPGILDGEPNITHIGIDINSVHSKNTTTLLPPLELEGNMTATVKFDNITQILVASLQVGSHPEPIVVSYQLPDLRTLLPREVAVGFSASTGTFAERHQILTWSFNSTLSPAIPPQDHDNKTTMIMIITIIGGLVLLVAVVWFILSCCKWTNRHRGIEKQGKHGPTQFQYQDLAAATNNFSEERKLGQGFFGVVYRGSLKKSGCDDVAVKKILNTSTGPNENSDFYAELNAITSVKHKNLVKLVGWCNGGSSFNFVEFMCWCCKNHNNNKLFLVYELVPKGNLHDHLYKEDALPWQIRYKIVKDITSALLYLHHECDPFILHRDIKPSNILLDDNFNAKLADFGLSRIVEDNSSKVLTIPVGTEAYLDPLCRKPVGKVEFSRSSDVYSFGIALLEIASGMPGSMLLREQVWQLYTRRCLLQAADAKLKGEFDRSQMVTVLVLGLWCSYPDNNKRPSMEQVIAVLEHGKPLPDDLNSLETTGSATELEMHTDPQAPTSAASSSYEQEQMKE